VQCKGSSIKEEKKNNHSQGIGKNATAKNWDGGESATRPGRESNRNQRQKEKKLVMLED